MARNQHGFTIRQNNSEYDLTNGPHAETKPIAKTVKKLHMCLKWLGSE